MGPVRGAETRDASRIAEILIFSKRTHYRAIFRNDAVSFGEMQVLPLAEEYQRRPEELKQIRVYDDGIVKGMVRVEDGEIRELYVDPFFEGQGVGSALLRFALERLDADRLWVLEKNSRARAFYQKHGFVLAGERLPEEGTAEYIIKMTRRIP